MTVKDDVRAARQAVRTLEHAVRTLAGRYGDTLDARRLTVDVERVQQDLDLLAGASAPESADPGPVMQVMEVMEVMETIDDTAYPQEFWIDAEDEGLGGSR